VYKPLATTVSFEEIAAVKAERVMVETKQVIAVFSTCGAVLDSVAFKNHKGKDKKPLQTIYHRKILEQSAFLLALDQKTPVSYTLESKKQLSDGVAVTFAASNDNCVIKKTFRLYHDTYRCEVGIELEPKNKETGLQPRIIFPAPHVQEIADDAITLCAWDEGRESLESHDPVSSKGLAWFWMDNKPLFGAHDRFFLHALVADKNNFVQRAYIKRYDDKTISNIVEGPVIGQKAAWQVSFYVGPKESQALQLVDARLVPLLSFGWFNAICNLLLKLLAYFNALLGNFGLAIIALTLALRLPFSPLMIYSRKQMEKFAKYEPSIARIRMKYRHDKATESEELMRFYRDHDLSPANQLAGCLPQLIQLPILFALLRVLNNSIDLYQAPFIGWIVDLSARDPYYVLPVLSGLVMIWANSLMAVVDEKKRVTSTFVALVVSAVFATFPAGLVLYQLTSNVLGLIEDYVRKIFFK